jgi:sulfate permease, SulP family
MPAFKKPWPLFPSLSGYRAGSFRYDVVAGLTLAAIAIPEQMATARLGGFSPHIGFFAFIAGSVAFAVLGSNRYLSAGADSTITPIFAGALTLLAVAGSPEYAALASVLALLVGALLTLAGIFRAGWVADLLSIPVTTGFLAGVAVHIAISQAPALLGVPGGEGSVFARLAEIGQHLGDVNLVTLAIGLSCLVLIILCEKISPRIPGALIALAAATLVVDWLGLQTRGVTVVGGFQFAAPHPTLPIISFDALTHLIGLAPILALVVMVQTAATSRSFPGAPGETPNVDRDYLGLGVGSALAGLFGAFPVNASPPRTAIVVETDGRSQIAGLVASAVVALVALYGAALLAHVPTAALAGLLLFVAGRIFRIEQMRDILGKTRAEFGLVVVTLLLVVILPVQTGVALAIMLSLIHGVYTTTRARLIEYERFRRSSVWWPESPRIAGEKLEGVVVVAFQAPLSFLNAYQFQHDLRKVIAQAGDGLRLVVLEASGIVEIDFTAARILDEVIAHCRSKGADFAVARLESARAEAALERFGVLKTMGAGRLFHSVDEATRSLAPDAAVRSS